VTTVTLNGNGYWWTCPKCGEENLASMRRVDVDLLDPEHDEFRCFLLYSMGETGGGDIVVDADDDDDDKGWREVDDNGGAAVVVEPDDGNDMTAADFDDCSVLVRELAVYIPPPVVVCGECRKVCKSGMMLV